ncbi:hypothetical protein H2203_003444 [Taxawa tesnikishii (nom. ined.)]|nr:hypothetical protein H2203_003444 [Dothideales sp. JES 119]
MAPFTPQSTSRTLSAAPTNSQTLSQSPAAQPTSQKRAAESDFEASNPQKRVKTKYDEPPIWARVRKTNPTFNGKNGPIPNPPKTQPPQATRPSPQPEAAAAPQLNGHMAIPNGNPSNARPPPPPAGMGPFHNVKERGKKLLGAWELSITDSEPTPGLLHELCDFLFTTMMLHYPDVGVGDPRQGGLEIEAKLGTLVDKDTEQRLFLPVTNPVALNRDFSRERTRFVSSMTEAQHSAMNRYLNGCFEVSKNHPGRVPMDYIHRYEHDSFATLSGAGYSLLPAAAKQHHNAARQRDLKLRTTTDVNKKNPKSSVIARIVKIRLADMDIYCPTKAYDCRISINIEVDLHQRQDIPDPSILTLPPDPKKSAQPDRKKDRLSYKHLAYSIDLTQVTEPDTGAKTHELEVEVDAPELRRQMARVQQGQENAFEIMAKGFLDNVMVLMDSAQR